VYFADWQAPRIGVPDPRQFVPPPQVDPVPDEDPLPKQVLPPLPPSLTGTTPYQPPYLQMLALMGPPTAPREPPAPPKEGRNASKPRSEPANSAQGAVPVAPRKQAKEKSKSKVRVLAGAARKQGIDESESMVRGSAGPRRKQVTEKPMCVVWGSGFDRGSLSASQEKSCLNAWRYDFGLLISLVRWQPTLVYPKMLFSSRATCRRSRVLKALGHVQSGVL
jgi:hypothetical protein